MKRISNVRCCVCGGKIMSEEDLTVCETVIILTIKYVGKMLKKNVYIAIIK